MSILCAACNLCIVHILCLNVFFCLVSAALDQTCIGLFYLKKKILYTTNCQIFNAFQNWEICCIQPSPLNQCFLTQQFSICAQWEPSEKCCATWATRSLQGWQDQAIPQVWVSIIFLSPWPLPCSEMQDREGWSEDLQEAVSLQCPQEESPPSDWAVSLLT